MNKETPEVVVWSQVLDPGSFIYLSLWPAGMVQGACVRWCCVIDKTEGSKTSKTPSCLGFTIGGRERHHKELCSVFFQTRDDMTLFATLKTALAEMRRMTCRGANWMPVDPEGEGAAREPSLGAWSAWWRQEGGYGFKRCLKSEVKNWTLRGTGYRFPGKDHKLNYVLVLGASKTPRAYVKWFPTPVPATGIWGPRYPGLCRLSRCSAFSCPLSLSNHFCLCDKLYTSPQKQILTSAKRSFEWSLREPSAFGEQGSQGSPW